MKLIDVGSELLASFIVFSKPVEALHEASDILNIVVESQVIQVVTRFHFLPAKRTDPHGRDIPVSLLRHVWRLTTRPEKEPECRERGYDALPPS